MALQSEELTNIKLYLLGEVTAEERETLEQRLLTDDDYFEEFRLAKEDLIDCYTEGEMTPEEREKFKKHFLITKERRESLKLAQSLIAYSSSQARKRGKKKDANRDLCLGFFPFFDTPASRRVCRCCHCNYDCRFYSLPSSALDTARGPLPNAAYRVERPIEARVSDFQHAPFADKRSGEPVQFDMAEISAISGSDAAIRRSE